MNLSSTRIRIRDARDVHAVRGLRLHTPMPPEIEPDAPSPPATDPDPEPDDPASDPSREPEGDPPVKPPPVRSAGRGLSETRRRASHRHAR
ncbi:hypothetical protein [Paraburkholderia fynbosensis]|uniref:Uncharacterized protein n=1 Tax=Paraburkholderia fynbosensis TaxID=1200993 RepID=A0A6J5G4R4_9BURK|nr:hypothetical protein [Paraburkholderia fynbosensis]CAB3793505.1 hypothetical protein LMG27177_03427 [Paraburkholderia fynbosensis]